MNVSYLMVIVMLSPLPFTSPFSFVDASNQYDVQYGPNLEYMHILNSQSYPIVGDQWKINFKTDSIPNTLTIRGINGTFFENDDLTFVQLIGENGIVLPSYDGEYIEFENYAGYGTVVFDVHTPGKHDLKFTRGNSVSYAHNNAIDLRIDFEPQTEYTYNVINPTSVSVLEIDSFGLYNIQYNLTVYPIYDIHDSTSVNPNDYNTLKGAIDTSIARINNSIYALVAAVIDDGVQIINITDPASPKPVYDINSVNGFGNLDQITDIVTAQIDGFTYALTISDGLNEIQIINITNISLPVSLDTLRDDASTILDAPRGIDIAQIGNHTYVLVASSTDNGIQIINITDPTSLQPVSNITDSVNLNFTSDVSIVKIDGHTYAIAAARYANAIQIINITNPISPDIVSNATYATGYTGLYEVFDVDTIKINGFTYVVTTSRGNDGIEIINITDPLLPTRTSNIPNPSEFIFGRDISTMHLDGLSYILASSFTNDTVAILNISDPTSPFIVANISDGEEYHELDGPRSVIPVEINGYSYAVVASEFDNGVQIIRLAHNTTAVQLPNFITTTNTNSSYAKADDNLTIQINANYEITSYNIANLTPGLTYTDVHNGSSLNVSITIPDDPLIERYLNFTITISNYNSSLVLTQNNLTGGDIFIDNIQPTISLVNFSNYTVLRNGLNQSIPGAVANDGSPGYVGNYTVKTNDTLNTRILDHTVLYTYTANEDAAGNPGASIDRTVTVVNPSIGVHNVQYNFTVYPVSVLFDDNLNALQGVRDVSTININGSTYALVTVPGDNIIQIINITNPASPEIVTAISNTENFTTSNFGDEIVTLQIDGFAYALYASTNNSVLQIINITNISSPSTLNVIRDNSTLVLNDISQIGIAIIENHTYALVTSKDDSGIQIINITNPEFPSITSNITSYITGNTILQQPFALSVVKIDDYTYALGGNILREDFFIINITNPKFPELVGTYNRTSSNYGIFSINSFNIDGSTYAVTGSFFTSKIEIINITKPSSYTYESKLPYAFNSVSDIDITQLDGRSYLTALAPYNDTVTIFDISDPELPYVAASLSDGLEYTILNYSSNLDFFEINGYSYALVTATGDNGIQIIRLEYASSTPLPILITSNNTNSSFARSGDVLTVEINANDTITSYDAVILDPTLNTTVTLVGENRLIASVIVPFEHAGGSATFNITIRNPNSSFVVTQNDLTGKNVFMAITVVNLTISSNNHDPLFAKTGDVIDIALQVTTQIQNATLIILNNTINMNVTNDTASANVTILQNSVNGPVSFNIAAYDNTGNRFTVTQANLTSENVTIDTIDPLLVNLTAYSDNYNSSLATTSNTLNITITANETLSFANITVLGNTHTMNVNGNTAYTTLTVNEGHAEGPVTFNITAFDLAGNSLTADQTHLDSSNVTIYYGIPGMGSLTIYSSNTNTNSSYAKADDNLTIQINANYEITSYNIANLTPGLTYTDVHNGSSLNVSITIPDDPLIERYLNFTITISNYNSSLVLTQNNLTGGDIFIDNIQPTISLVNFSNYTVLRNGLNQSIPGAVANDGSPGYVGNYTVKTNDTLNARILDHTVLYTYTANEDAAGNPGASIDRTVTVVNPSIGVHNVQYNFTVYPVSVLFDDNLNALQGVRDVSTININGSTYALVTVPGDNIIQIINITNPASPEIVTAIANTENFTTSNFDDEIVTLQIDGFAYALYASFDNHILQIINITNISSPSTLNVIRDNSTLVLDRTGQIGIAIIENHTYALVTSIADNGIQIINITNPEFPSITSNITDSLIDQPFALSIVKIDDYTYALTANFLRDTIRITNITNPKFPELVGTYPEISSVYGISSINSFNIDGSTYAVTGSFYKSKIEIINITKPSFYTYESKLPYASDFVHDIDITQLDGRSYLTALAPYNDTVTIFDISDPELPYVAASLSDGLEYTILNYSSNLDFFEINGYSYALVTATGDNGIQIIRLEYASSTPLPILITSNNTNSSFARSGDVLTVEINANDTITSYDAVILDPTLNTTVTLVGENRLIASVIVPFEHAGGSATFNITIRNPTSSFVVTQNDLTGKNVFMAITVVNLTISSNNHDPLFAKTGDVIDIALQVTTQIQNATLIILNNTINMNVTNDTASANVTILQNSVNGPVSFNIAAYDNTGNRFTVTQANLTSENVTIDTIDPLLVNLTAYSDNYNSSLATTSNTLNITITANETLSFANITVLGNTRTMSVNGNMANTTLTVNESHAEGPVTFNITAFDLAGNSLTADQTHLDSSNVTIYYGIPGMGSLTIYSSNTNTNSSYAKADDNLTIQINANYEITSYNIANLTPGLTYTDVHNGSSLNVSITIPDDPLIERYLNFTITISNYNSSLVLTQNNLTGGDIFIDNIQPTISLVNFSNYTVLRNGLNQSIPGAVANDGSPGYVGNYTVKTNDTLNTRILDHTVLYTYTANEDAAGNPGASIDRTVTVVNPSIGVHNVQYNFTVYPVSVLFDDNLNALQGVRDVSTININGSTYALVTVPGDNIIQIINITNPASPEIVTAIANTENFTTSNFDDEIVTLQIDGFAYALYASFDNHILQIINITNISSPSTLNVIRDNSTLVLDRTGQIGIAIIENHTYALVTSIADNGIQIINITNPEFPSITSNITDSLIDQPFALSIVKIDDYTYALTANFLRDTIRITNITNPKFPELVGTYPEISSVYGISSINSFNIDGSTYAVTGSFYKSKIEIINITKPSFYTYESKLPYASDFVHDIDITQLDGRSYLTALAPYNDTVTIFDISDPELPYVAASLSDGLEYTILNYSSNLDFFEINGYSYALVTATGDNGIQIIRLEYASSTPLPILITSNNTNSSFARSGDVLTVEINANDTITSYDAVILDPTLNTTVTLVGENRLIASVIVPFEHAGGSATFNITIRNPTSSFVVTQNDLTGKNVFMAITVVNLTISSNNHDPLFAKTGDVIDIALQVTTQIQNATLIILNNTINMNVTNDTASANVTILQNSVNGPVSFNIAAYDNTGNRFTVTQANLTSENVTIDTIDPLLVNLTAYSDNYNSSLATTSNTLNITITANETLSFANITVLGNTRTMSVNGNMANTTLTVNESHAEGPVTFNITAFDLAGNTLSVDQRNLTSSNVTIDRTNPELTNLTIYSDNSDTSLATTGDILNITITANEALQGANITVLGDTYVMAVTGTVANTFLTVNDTHPDGKVDFNITAFDLAGNTLSVDQRNLTSSNVTIDRTNPELTNLTIYSDNSDTSLATTGDILNITITANEALQGANITVLGDTYVMAVTGTVANAFLTVNDTHPDGKVDFNITAFDLAGNTLNADPRNLTSTNVTIDHTAPGDANLIVRSNNADPTLAKAGDVINITLQATEPIMNATLQIFDDNITMTVTNDTASANITVPQNATNGQIMFNITAEDSSGNTFSVTQTNITSSGVRIDTINPQLVNLTIYSNNSNTSLATINDILTITITSDETLKDANVTVLDKTQPMTVSGATASVTVTVNTSSQEGNVTFDITTIDLAGNTLSVDQRNLTSSNVTIDSTNPELTNLTIYSDNSDTSLATTGDILNITITANEALQGANITVLGDTYVMAVTGTVANAFLTVNDTHPDGKVDFNITAFDLAGNTLNADPRNLTSTNVTIDHTAPGDANLIVRSNNADPTLAKAGDVINITLQATEPIMNATLQIFDDNITMTVTNDTASANITVPQNATNGQIMFNITAEDRSGNTFSVTQTNITSSGVRIDTINPQLVNLTIYSNNSNTSLATINDILTITITSDETLKDANVTVLDKTQPMTVSGATASVTVTVNTSSQEGNVTFDITTIDLAGNTLSVDQRNLTSSNVTIDSTNPELTNLTIYSDNSDTSLATTGDILNITITANEALQGANITVLGDTYVMAVTGTVANAFLTVNDTHPDGKVDFNITAFDLAGNTLSIDQRNLTSTNVTIDHTAPGDANLIVRSNNADPTLAKAGDVINITLQATEPIMNATLQIFDDNNITMTVTNDTASANITVPQNATNGQIMFNITAEDSSGNTFSVTQTNITSSGVRIDTINPQLVNLTIYSNNSNTSLATINDILTITITSDETLKDANVTVLDKTQPMTVSGATASVTVTVNTSSQEGNVTFDITTIDLAGNTLSVDQRNLTSSNVTIDSTNPELTNLTIYSDNSDTSLATTGDILNITITANEALQGANITVLGDTYVMAVTGTVANAFLTVNDTHPDGKVDFNITAFDLAGNTLSIDQRNLTSTNVTIDHTAPGDANLIVRSNNADPTLAKAGDVINITLQATEPIMNATLQIFDDNITMTVTNDTASANITVPQNATNGQIMFNITAEDSSGNTFSVTQTNITSSGVRIDTINPQLVNLTIYSNNSNTSLATINDILTITITSDETLKDANVTVLDKTQPMTVSGATASVTVTVNTSSQEGNVTFDITTIDLAGNTLSVDQRNLTSSNVTIDSTNPELTNLTIYSDNSDTSLATTGDILNITITANEALQGANITVLGDTYVMAVTGTVANAFLTVNDTHPDGKVDFNITAFDLAGNFLVANHTQLNSSNVTIDKSLPGVENLTIYSNNFITNYAKESHVLIITITANEALKEANITVLGATRTMSISGAVANVSLTVNSTTPEGIVLFNITTFDLTGNTLVANHTHLYSPNVTIDRTNPELTNLTIYSDNFRADYAKTSHMLNITITANETLSFANITVLGNTHTMSINGNTANTTLTVNEGHAEGPVTFNITAFDLAGNSLTADQTHLDSSIVTIDKMDPHLTNLTIYSDNSNSSLATTGNTLNITITANETLSFANITVLGNTHTMSINGNIANTTLTVNEGHAEGPVTFNITAFDLAGNSLTADQTHLDSSIVTIDHSIPRVDSLIIYSSNVNPSFAKAGDVINITLQATEPIQNAILIILNDTINMNITNDTASAIITVLQITANGPVSFNITAHDIVGNAFTVSENSLTSGSVTIDTINPELTNLTIYSDNFRADYAKTSHMLNITITANETLSFANITVLGNTHTMSVNGNTANTTLTVNEGHAEGPVTFNITAFDLAGNSLTADQTHLDSSIVTIDKTDPHLTNLTIYSDNPNSSLAKVGNVINITLQASEKIWNATLIILNNTIDMSVTNDTAFTNITVLQDTANGLVEFNITIYDDAANMLDVTHADLVSDNVVIDTIDPSLVNLTIYSDNPNPSYAKAGDLITITLTTTEPIGNVNATILGKTANTSINGSVSIASILIEQDATNGQIEFKMDVFDNTGNAYVTTYTQYNLQTDNVFVDTEIPVIELILDAHSASDLDGNVGDRVKINNTYNDPGSRVYDNDPNYDGTANTTSNVNISAIGVYYVKYDATDNAGNIAQFVYRTVSVLTINGSVNAVLPLPIPTPVIYSHIAYLNTTEWNENNTISFNHNLIILINNTMVIKIENSTVFDINTQNITNFDFDNFLIHGSVLNNSHTVSLGHNNIKYDISSSAVMITFINVRDLSNVPFYWETLNGPTTNITRYYSNDIQNGTIAHQILSDNLTLNGSMYTVDAENRRITVWTTHLTSYAINDIVIGSNDESDDDNSAPTMGLGSIGNRLVENGFEYNGLAVNANRYYTEFPLIGTNVGSLNTLKMKFYDSAGPAGIKRVEIAFGVPDIGLYHEAEAFVEIWMQQDALAVQEIVIEDKLNILEDSDISVTVSETSCSGGAEQCLLVDLKYSYKESPAYETVAIKPVDWDNDAFQFYFNDGIHVYGDSLNLPKEIIISSSHAISDNREQLHLIQTDRINGIWVDQYGSTWEINENNIRQITTSYEEQRIEKSAGILHGPNRHHESFESVKQLEAQKAHIVVAELLGSAYHLNPLPEHDKSIYFYVSDSNGDKAFITILKLENERMQKLADEMYGNLHDDGED